MPIPKLVLMLVCLMSFTLEPLEPKEASKEDPKEAEVTPLFSKDLADFPGKEGLMITVEYPPGSTDPIHRHNAQAFVYVLEGSIVMQVKGGKEVTLTPGSSAELAAQEAGKRAALGKSKDVGAKYQGKLPSEPTYDMLQEADRKIEKLQEQVGTFEFHGYLRSGYGLNGEGGSRLHSRHPGLMRNTALEMKRKPMRN